MLNEVLKGEFRLTLNEQQTKALQTIKGPLLILAGPGSGKTTTITARYQYLLSQGIKPEEILMVTFTRKAANEMKMRIQSQTPGINFHSAWVDTFHRICMDILREEGQHLGIPTDFKVCSNYKSKEILNELIHKHQLSGGSDEEEASVTKENLFEYMGALKTLLVSPNAFIKEAPTLNCMDWEKADRFIRTLKQEQPSIAHALEIIYPEFQRILLQQKLLEFEDMILYTVVLFEKSPDILHKYQQRIKYIQVDEFQDTNLVQLKLLQLLAGDEMNICVVGDDAQSIYGFRGSDIENILFFERHFPGASTVKLEQNYRSTQHIVSFSNRVIKQNKKQKQKEMFTDQELGEKVKVWEVQNEEEEALKIAKEIKKEVETGNYTWSDVAVLFRNNFQANRYAKVFSEQGISFQITGDTEFADRIEVRDMLAYLRILESPNDIFSFRRIINKPKRGIGPKAVDYIFSSIQEPIYEFLQKNEDDSHFTKAGKQGIQEIINVYETSQAVLQTEGIAATIEHLLRQLDYEKRAYEKSFPWIQEEVAEGLTELIRLAKVLEVERGKVSVEEFQEYLRDLYVDNEHRTDKVTLMTVHKSKGLEFPLVFVTGLDNLTFPNEEKDEEEQDIEEERRVFYVAITRAKDKLYLSYPLVREKRVNGQLEQKIGRASLFLQETWNSEDIIRS